MIPTAEVAERAARMSPHRDLSNTVTIWKKSNLSHNRSGKERVVKFDYSLQAWR